jgi:signal transduction histidine kinase
MDESKPAEEVISWGQQNRNEKQLAQALQQAEDKIREAEALLLMIDTVSGELKQPLTVLLGVSHLLLAKVDQNDPIATDLSTIVKQVKRITEIINGVDHLTQY